MISFKDFLAETAIVKWKADPVKVKKAIAYLNANCRDGLKAISTGGILFRGFQGGMKDSYVIMDSSKAVRTSRDTNNLYQLMMEASEAFKGYPKRSNSFICTTEYNDAMRYGSVYAMIPFDGTKIAVVDSNDIFNIHFTSDILNIDDDISVDDLSTIMGRTLAALGIKSETKNDFLSGSAIDAALSKFSPEQIFCVWIEYMGYWYDFVEEEKIPEEIKDKFQNGWKSKKVNRKLGEFLTNNPQFLTNSGKKLYSILKNNTSKRFTTLSTEICTPKKFDTQLKTFGERLPRNRECWFSGKCLAINLSLFADIIHALAKAKTIKIDPVLLDFSRDYSSY
jgi:hypothetical protein